MKLEYQNNWNHDVYTVGGRRLLTLTKVRINRVDYTVSNREVDVMYSDMGHTGTARSTHYFVKTKVFGKMREFDLNAIDMPITVLKYTVGEKP